MESCESGAIRKAGCESVIRVPMLDFSEWGNDIHGEPHSGHVPDKGFTRSAAFHHETGKLPHIAPQAVGTALHEEHMLFADKYSVR